MSNESPIQDPADPNVTPGGSDENHETETVSRKAYEKVLSEKKKAAEALRERNARLAELEAEREALSMKDAEAKGEYQKVIEAERKKYEAAIKRIQELEGTISEFNSREMNRKKFGAIYDQLGGAVDKKFFPLIDLDQVELNEDGEIDEQSVAKYANELKELYPEIITPKKGALPPSKLPGDGKGSGGKRIAESEWRNLPTRAEMAKYKHADIDWGR